MGMAGISGRGGGGRGETDEKREGAREGGTAGEGKRQGKGVVGDGKG